MMTQCIAWRKLLLLTAGYIAVALPAAFGQGGASAATASSPDADSAYMPTLTFDVASIRQSPPADSYRVSGSFSPHSSSLSVTNFDVMNLVILAYGVQPYQLSGLPDWRAMFNIQAKSDSAADDRMAKLSMDQERLEQQHMVQVLLADRFHLKVHWETGEGPTYDLVVTKRGRLQAAKGNPPSPEDLKFWGDKSIPPLYQRGDSRVGFDFIAHGCSMGEIADMLAGQFGLPVSDETGLTGKYDFDLKYYQTRYSDRRNDDLNPLSPLESAIQDQLGLMLKPSNGSIPTLVIDHIEMPSPN